MPKDEKPPAPPANNPFGALAHLRDSLPQAPAQPQQGAPQMAAKEMKGPARAVVRKEKKGRGGKEVTVVEQLGLPAKQLEVWLKALKNALGCGGAVEGDTLVLQGEHRDRLKLLLEERG
ncbi:MAG: translation initiation factor, partial [Deltaproteobacteria bacterium]|nr:translation initiation factor [Deltaproteobacteria bacterium]